MWDGKLAELPPPQVKTQAEEVAQAASEPDFAPAEPVEESIFSGLPEEARAVAEAAARVVHISAGRASDTLEGVSQVAQSFSPEASSLLATTAALARRLGW